MKILGIPIAKYKRGMTVRVTSSKYYVKPDAKLNKALSKRVKEEVSSHSILPIGTCGVIVSSAIGKFKTIGYETAYGVVHKGKLYFYMERALDRY